jgi:hypothetical protein
LPINLGESMPLLRLLFRPPCLDIYAGIYRTELTVQA